MYNYIYIFLYTFIVSEPLYIKMFLQVIVIKSSVSLAMLTKATLLWTRGGPTLVNPFIPDFHLALPLAAGVPGLVRQWKSFDY